MWLLPLMLGVAGCLIGAYATGVRLNKINGSLGGSFGGEYAPFTMPLFGRVRCPICWIVSAVIIGGLAAFVAVMIYLLVSTAR